MVSDLLVFHLGHTSTSMHPCRRKPATLSWLMHGSPGAMSCNRETNDDKAKQCRKCGTLRMLGCCASGKDRIFAGGGNAQGALRLILYARGIVDLVGRAAPFSSHLDMMENWRTRSRPSRIQSTLSFISVRSLHYHDLHNNVIVHDRLVSSNYCPLTKYASFVPSMHVATTHMTRSILCRTKHDNVEKGQDA